MGNKNPQKGTGFTRLFVTEFVSAEPFTQTRPPLKERGPATVVLGGMSQISYRYMIVNGLQLCPFLTRGLMALIALLALIYLAKPKSRENQAYRPPEGSGDEDTFRSKKVCGLCGVPGA